MFATEKREQRHEEREHDGFFPPYTFATSSRSLRCEGGECSACFVLQFLFSWVALVGDRILIERREHRHGAEMDTDANLDIDWVSMIMNVLDDFHTTLRVVADVLGLIIDLDSNIPTPHRGKNDDAMVFF